MTAVMKFDAKKLETTRKHRQ